jgi:hypothetical protein
LTVAEETVVALTVATTGGTGADAVEAGDASFGWTVVDGDALADHHAGAAVVLEIAALIEGAGIVGEAGGAADTDAIGATLVARAVAIDGAVVVATAVAVDAALVVGAVLVGAAIAVVGADASDAGGGGGAVAVGDAVADGYAQTGLAGFGHSAISVVVTARSGDAVAVAAFVAAGVRLAVGARQGDEAISLAVGQRGGAALGGGTIGVDRALAAFDGLDATAVADRATAHLLTVAVGVAFTAAGRPGRAEALHAEGAGVTVGVDEAVRARSRGGHLVRAARGQQCNEREGGAKEGVLHGASRR